MTGVQTCALPIYYDEQTLMDFAAAKAGSMTVPFQATGFEYLDEVAPPI